MRERREIAGEVCLRCPGCGEWKPESTAYYRNLTRGRPYASARCKPCASLQSQERQEREGREIVNARWRHWAATSNSPTAVARRGVR